MSYELSLIELDAECAELLPAREALFVFNLDVTTIKIARVNASNYAVTLGGGDLSYTTAFAGQGIVIGQ